MWQEVKNQCAEDPVGTALIIMAMVGFLVLAVIMIIVYGWASLSIFVIMALAFGAIYFIVTLIGCLK